MQVFAKAPTWLAIMAVPKRDDAIAHAMDRAGVRPFQRRIAAVQPLIPGVIVDADQVQMRMRTAQ